MKYYNDPSLGVVGVEPGPTDGEFTCLTGRIPQYTWIRTDCLYATAAEAAEAEPATVLDAFKAQHNVGDALSDEALVLLRRIERLQTQHVVDRDVIAKIRSALAAYDRTSIEPSELEDDDA